MSKIEELERQIAHQKSVIDKLQADVSSLQEEIDYLLEPHGGCRACAISGQMCYECFYGPDRD